MIRTALFLSSLLLALFTFSVHSAASTGELVPNPMLTEAETIPQILYGTSGAFYQRLSRQRLWIGSNGKMITPLDASGTYFTDGNGKLLVRSGQILVDN